jgi:lysophospholipase L1-like esterase
MERVLLLLAALASWPLLAQNVDSLAAKKMVFLGDSITQGGAYITYSSYYLEKLYPQKNFDIYGLGLGSETVSGLSEPNHAGGAFPRPCLFDRLDRLFERLKPDVVLACYGINDGIYLPLDAERFAAFRNGISKLLAQCKAAGVKEIFLITPPIYDLSPKPGEFNYDSVLTEYAAWEMTLKIPSVHVIDLHTAMRKARDARTEVFSNDHVHPGEEGHLLMAKTILAAVGIQIPNHTPAEIAADPLFKLVAEKRDLRSTRWMNHIGYTRETTVAPQPLGNTEGQASKLQEQIDLLRRKA